MPTAFLMNKPEATELAITCQTFGVRPSRWVGIDDNPGLACEFDRTCAVYYQEWLDEREEYRLKKVLNWFMGGEESKGRTKAARCEHGDFKKLPDGQLECGRCGERGN